MILDFTCVRRDEQLRIEVSGDILLLNGARLDFGPLPEGGMLPRDAIASEWIGSGARREQGHVRVTVVLPCGPEAPAERRFAKTMTITDDGPVALPPYGDAEIV
ncbi:hypothetical protein [uncultured Zoogloea sp.]|uniref:hypothetical protein n=1 Tax=uncultured Zoogloea sp. TaxID=160237 RepID=UPI002616BAF5|nr:hypothetical protein [uncultured Zoogloea sp.]